MNRFPFSITVGLALILLAPASLFAQSTDVDAGQAARFHLGPLALTPRVALTNLGFDSNVFNDPNAPQGDFTAALGPELDSSLRLGRADLTGKTIASWTYFQKATSQRSVDLTQTGTATLALVRFTPHAAAGYVTSRQRPNDEIDVRVRHVTTSADGGVTFAAGPRLSLDVDESREAITYDDTTLSPLLDRTTTSTTGSARFAMTPLTAFVVKGAVTHDRFALAADRNGDSVGVSAGVEFKPAALLNGSASVGYRSLTPRVATLPGFTGLIANGDLSYTVKDATRIEVRINRDLDYSFEETDYYYVATGGSLQLTQELGAGWDVNGQFGRTNLEYPTIQGFIDGVEGTSGETDRVTTVGLGAGRRLGSDVRIGINVLHMQRRSPFADRTYKGYGVGGTVSYGF